MIMIISNPNNIKVETHTNATAVIRPWVLNKYQLDHSGNIRNSSAKIETDPCAAVTFKKNI
jgi:hypothetical protein